ncbi:MAG: hypothetical protein P8Y65_09985, partial [Campylobacterales bacterium]
ITCKLVNRDAFVLFWSEVSVDKVACAVDRHDLAVPADGSTSGGGEWGVSRDGKVMTIDGTSYLVYRYLRPKEDKCIAVYELAGDIITPSVWKLCKQ